MRTAILTFVLNGQGWLDVYGHKYPQGAPFGPETLGAFLFLSNKWLSPARACICHMHIALDPTALLRRILPSHRRQILVSNERYHMARNKNKRIIGYQLSSKTRYIRHKPSRFSQNHRNRLDIGLLPTTSILHRILSYPQKCRERSLHVQRVPREA